MLKIKTINTKRVGVEVVFFNAAAVFTCENNLLTNFRLNLSPKNVRKFASQHLILRI